MASINKIDLEKKFFCIVSGASKGIGRAIALKLAAKFKSDSLFILLARSEKELSETKTGILKVNPSLRVVSKIIDLSKPNCDDFRKVFIDSLEKHSLQSFDAAMIVHNVGTVGDVTKKIIELNNIAYWQDYYNLNVFGVAMLNSEFFKVINEAPKNDKFKTIVINITSIIGIKPFKNMGYYGSGKAAREMIFRVLAEEEKDVLVLNYSPGPVKTEMIYSIIDNVGDPEMKKNFQSLRDEDKILTTDQTTSKLLEVLETGNYKSGDHVDYFD